MILDELFLDRVTCGDCLEVMALLPDACVDMVLCDLPYGTTQNKWDNVLDLLSLWDQYRRIIKPCGAIVLTTQLPFSFSLAASNPDWLRYEWIWEKPLATGFLNANRCPLKAHENVLIFASGQTPYYAQFEARGGAYKAKRSRNGSNYGSNTTEFVDTGHDGGRRYPRSVIKFAPDHPKIHPTQKPVALFEYLIRTYTKCGELVIDNCCGSGTTGVAAKQTGRHSIQIDSNEEYCLIAERRLTECTAAAS